MLVEYDFAVLQTEYVLATMGLFPAFRPDGKSPAAVETLLADADADRTAHQTADAALTAGRAERNEAARLGHDAARDVFANARSRYRKDKVATASIDRLPVDDQTVAQTLKRLEAIALLWAKLPVPPDTAPEDLPPPPPAPQYVPWPGMDLPEFLKRHERLEKADKAIPKLSQAAQKAEGQLHVRGAELSDFATAAAAQGRSQFAVGTVAREVVDALPSAPATQPPGPATITAATSPAKGEALLVYDAPHGTRFDVFHQAPGAAEFVPLAEGVLLKRFTAKGLAAGSHGFKVVAKNSVGTGPESAAVNVAVG